MTKGQKISLALMGHKHSEATKLKLSQTMKARGLKPLVRFQTPKKPLLPKICVACNSSFSATTERDHHHWVSKKTCSPVCTSTLRSRTSSGRLEHIKQMTFARKGLAPWNKGKPFLAIRGEKNVNWKGGVTPLNEKKRRSLEYKYWRRNVFQRDNYTCQSCGTRGTHLHADHVMPFAFYPDLQFEILNGRTLCRICHLKTPTWAAKHDIYEFA